MMADHAERSTGTSHPDQPKVPLVTVCVPSVGRVEYLRSSLNSLRLQSYENLEILLLDNASESPAKDLLHGFASTHVRARVLRTAVRIPMFANFNRGIREASGTYVVFFHDDDLYAPTFISRYVDLLEQYPSAGFAGGNFDVIDSAGTVVRSRRLISETGIWDGKRFIEDLMRRGRGLLPTPGLMYRREIIARNGFDETLPINWGDFTVLMRMAETSDVAVLAESLFAWRVHGKNESNMSMSTSLPIRSTVFRNYCAEYERRHPDDSEFVTRLQAHVERSGLTGLLWGWLAGIDESDAAECLTQMRAARRGRKLSFALAALESAGLSLARRRSLLPLVRRVGGMFGA